MNAFLDFTKCDTFTCTTWRFRYFEYRNFPWFLFIDCTKFHWNWKETLSKKKSRGNMTLEQLECLQEFKNSAIICNIIFSFFLLCTYFKLQKVAKFLYSWYQSISLVFCYVFPWLYISIDKTQTLKFVITSYSPLNKCVVYAL